MNFPLSRFLIGSYTVILSGLMIALRLLGIEGLNWTLIAAASGLVMIISTWLGVDLTGALSRSFDLPKGKAEKIDISRYVFSLFMLLSMIIALLIKPITVPINDEALAILIVAIGMVLGFWVGSRKAIRIAKQKGSSNGKAECR
ncbi:MAG: hypothetical protein AAF975_00630 [Spirochaetota bacterium]